VVTNNERNPCVRCHNSGYLRCLYNGSENNANRHIRRHAITPKRKPSVAISSLVDSTD